MYKCLQPPLLLAASLCFIPFARKGTALRLSFPPTSLSPLAPTRPLAPHPLSSVSRLRVPPSRLLLASSHLSPIFPPPPRRLTPCSSYFLLDPGFFPRGTFSWYGLLSLLVEYPRRTSRLEDASRLAYLSCSGVFRAYIGCLEAC